MANRAPNRGRGSAATVLKAVERALVHPSTQWLLRTTGVLALRRALRWRREHKRWLEHDSRLVLHNGSAMYPLAGRTPAEIAAANAELVYSTLDEAGIPYTAVRHQGATRTTIAIPSSHKRQLLEALTTRHADDAIYVATMAEYTPGADADSPSVPSSPLARRRQPVGRFSDRIAQAAVIRLWRFYLDPPSGLVLGSSYGCEIEFWHESTDPQVRWIAPRANVAGNEFSASDVALLPRKRHLPRLPRTVFDLRMIDEIDFPIDVVYTWVDNRDPAWRRRFEYYGGNRLPEGFHWEAGGEQRFRSRDELKYSLRSLSMYAPWVRHVYIVTDDQVPEFIDFDRPGITLVDHREIARVPEALPTFNSSAITSWLHRIPGLTEHFLYLNDDVFVGRDITPARLFTPSGLARVFPSYNRRPFGPPDPADEPHVNITRNIRALLEQEFGRSISRSVKHTPHAQLVSVHEEMEKRFSDAYGHLDRSRFRHHHDIAADQLFHYYAQITGRAVVSSIRYAYINIGDARNESELARLLAGRDREVFCLNDAPGNNSTPMTNASIHDFLEAYFPVPSKWERRSLSLHSPSSPDGRRQFRSSPRARRPERRSA